MGNVTQTVKDIIGTDRTVHTTATMFRYQIAGINGPDDGANYGGVVGTGTTAPTNSDYQLETQIAHGVGAGQLDYGVQSFTNAAVVSSNVDFVTSRDFYNGSGSTITVTEIGVYAQAKDTVGNTRFFCIIRDVLASSQDVLDTQTLTVQYTMRTTV